MAFKISLFTLAFVLLSLHHTEAQIGVDYGRNGNNLPCPEEVVHLYEVYKIGAMRLYEPNLATLKAIQRTNIKLMLGVSNNDTTYIACNQATSDTWVRTNVIPYASSIKYVVVGNEIEPSDPQASSIALAMQNILNSLNSNKLCTHIIVTTAIKSDLLINTFPPSSSEFKNLSYITPIIKFLLNNDWPLVANIQPYVAFINNPQNITLDFVLFTSCGFKFIDGITGKGYQNLFDALYDSVYVAVKKVADSIGQYNSSRNGYIKKPVPGEVGHPSRGGFHHGHKLEFKKGWISSRKEIMDKGTMQCGYPKGGGDPGTVENARIFYTNMIKHVKKGTPLTQGQELEVFLFAMFDENLKDGDESERHYGLFTPDGQPKYGITNFDV